MNRRYIISVSALMALGLALLPSSAISQSLDVNHAPATEVGPNDDFGLKVVGHVREHDVVYKVRP